MSTYVPPMYKIWCGVCGQEGPWDDVCDLCDAILCDIDCWDKHMADKHRSSFCLEE